MNKGGIVLMIVALLAAGCAPVQTQVPAERAPQVQETVPAAVETEVVVTEAVATVPVVTETTVVTPAVVTEAVETEEAAATEAVVDAAALEAVIAEEMRESFDFFWEQANTEVGSPGYGLIRDRYPGSPGIASMAAVGFGLTAYLIGVEKGYITNEQAYERVNGTLDTLLAMERVEGFYYHFVDMESGKRAWNSEVSNIDTSILLMGVLSAGEYFGGEIETKAKQIYDAVNWPWFLDVSRDMFYMAYSPEKGFAGHWDFYAEQLMLYILAAGSDTHPIEASPYYAFTRHYGKYGDGEGFIHSWFGSIFTYQYSHAWIDFRGYTDQQEVNWFENSVDASLAHYQFAVDNDEKYPTLGPDAWGLTASDGPEGYNGLYGAPPSGFDNKSHVVDDTVPPSGAIGSIVFMPQQAGQAMLNYASIEPLDSDYGFLDAYNLSEDWYATDVIGIDKGITLLMLANYESDMVYKITMENKNLLQGMQRLQILQEGQ